MLSLLCFIAPLCGEIALLQSVALALLDCGEGHSSIAGLVLNHSHSVIAPLWRSDYGCCIQVHARPVSSIGTSAGHWVAPEPRRVGWCAVGIGSGIVGTRVLTDGLTFTTKANSPSQPLHVPSNTRSFGVYKSFSGCYPSLFACALLGG